MDIQSLGQKRVPVTNNKLVCAKMLKAKHCKCKGRVQFIATSGIKSEIVRRYVCDEDGAGLAVFTCSKIS